MVCARDGLSPGGREAAAPTLIGLDYLNGPYVWVGDNNAPVAQVVLGAPAEGDTVVSVQSSTSEVVVPSQVTVPAGSTTAVVPVTAVAEGTSTLTATLGLVNVSATPDLDTRSTITPTSLDGLAIEPGSVSTGGTAVATVSLDFLAQPGGSDIMITSTPSGLGVPTHIVVPENQYRATFDVMAPTGSEGHYVVTATLGDVVRTAALDVTEPSQSDPDGDGLSSGEDRCPTIAGSAADGCPDVRSETGLSYRASATEFRGKVVTSPACRAGRMIKVFRVRGGADAKVGTATTRRGTFAVDERARRGRYYAKAFAKTSATANCLPDRSATVRVR